jgi:hypothetical protein
MARQGYDLQLTRYDERGWRATFYTSGMEHSPTSATGTAWERTPWHAAMTSRQKWLAQELWARAAIETRLLASAQPDCQCLLGLHQSDVPRVAPRCPLRTPLHVVPFDQKLRRVRPAEREPIAIEGAE